jgi:pimeloyl-ACP methyl ester carboxylesterase
MDMSAARISAPWSIGAASRVKQNAVVDDDVSSTHHSPPTIIRANGVDLCVQTFGHAAAPAILLIAGAACSMDWWDDELCERLAVGPRLVIRYDLRDTGQSVSYPAGAPEYDGTDLVADAVGILDELEIERAHVVGMSMGGGIAEVLALDRPERVASLTLISTSPGGADLPATADKLASHFAQPPPTPDWSDREAVIDYLVDDARPYSGSHGFDEQRMRALAGRIVDRTRDIEASFTNHSLLDGGKPLRPRLGEIAAPTLVVHGTEDPLFPFAHAEALAAEIPGARLLPLAGVGHGAPPPATWDELVPAILGLTRSR